MKVLYALSAKISKHYQVMQEPRFRLPQARQQNDYRTVPSSRGGVSSHRVGKDAHLWDVSSRFESL